MDRDNRLIRAIPRFVLPVFLGSLLLGDLDTVRDSFEWYTVNRSNHL